MTIGPAYGDELSGADKAKLAGIEALADVTDAANVDAAGAVMNADTTTAAMAFVIDEDDMSSDSATKVPTQQSVKAHTLAAVVSQVSYQGGYDANTNTPDLDTSPAGILIGFMYTVTAVGAFFATTLEIGDVLIAEKTNPTVEDDWTVVQKDLDAASIKVSYESNADTNEFSDAQVTKLAGIEAAATADQTGAEIKTAYEGEASAFTDSQFTKLAALPDVGEVAGVRTPTGDDTLVIGDVGKVIEMNAATAKTITIPPNGDVAFPINTIIHFTRFGAGTVQILPGTAVTIRSADGDDFIATQYSGATAYKRGTNEWVLFGNLAAS